jgi:hypothetical protein
MSIRRKYILITISAVLLASLTVVVMSAVHLHGYALLPLVILAGLFVYTAYQSFLNVLFPEKNLVEGSIIYMLIDLLSGGFGH